MLNYTPVYRKRQKDCKWALTFRGRCFFVIFLPSFYVLSYSKWWEQDKRIKEGGSKWLYLTREVSAPKDRCRELQSEFCDGLRITSRKPLKLRYNFISRCSKADYPYNRRTGNTESKSYHGYGNGQGDIWKIGDTFLIDLLRCSVLWFPQKIRTHFHAVVWRR